MMKNLFIFTLVLSVLCFAGCRRAKKKGDNILNVAVKEEIPHLDPANSYDVISASVLYQCYETLFEYHYLKRPYTLQPLLASEMPKISKDGKTYIIKIKKGIPYHDDPAFQGKVRHVSANDFITQIKRLAYKKTKSNGWWLFEGRIKGLDKFRETTNNFADFKKNSISGVNAIDGHTLKIELVTPYPQMLYALALTFTTPIPIEVVERLNNDLSRTVVGTGPFKLNDGATTMSVRLSKFTYYRKDFYPRNGDRLAYDQGLLKDAGMQIPFVDGINYHVMKEAQTKWLNFMKKKIDFLVIPKDNYNKAIDHAGRLTAELRKDNIKLHISPTLTYWWFSFNMSDPIVGTNRNLRMAIAYAIDVERYIDLFTNNIGQKSNSIYPPGIPGYDPAKQLPYRYDQKKAREYLVKAGYPAGKGLPLLTFDVRGAGTVDRQKAEFVKSELEKIGIKLKIAINTFPRFLDKERTGKLQFWQGGWALDYPDAENILQLLITKNHPPGPNATHFSNKIFDSYFKKLKIMKDGEDKFKIMDKMEKIIKDEIPWVMMYYDRNYILYHGHLKNYRHADLIYNNMKYLRIEKE